jgi:hypothetical protein
LRWRIGGPRTIESDAFFCRPPTTADDALCATERLEPGKWCPPAVSQASSLPDRLQTRRTAAFLRWRYAQHPHIPYYAESIGTGDRPDGILFYRTNVRRGLREIMIDDVLVGDGLSHAAKRLLDQLCSTVDAHYIVAHAADDSPLVDCLRSLRFRRVPGRRISLVARPLVQTFTLDPCQQANWSLCLGDLEGL